MPDRAISRGLYNGQMVLLVLLCFFSGVLRILLFNIMVEAVEHDAGVR
jgi:hypothetical protein